MGKPEILKCPRCGDLPERVIDPWDGRYYCHCERYTCNFYESTIADSKADAIKAWNEKIRQYKEAKDE